MSRLAVGSLEGLASEGYKISVASGSQLVQAGAILQVMQTVKTDAFSTTSTTFADVTGLSATITPSSTSSKILVMAHVSVGISASTQTAVHIQLAGGNSGNYVGDAASNRVRAAGTVRNEWSLYESQMTQIPQTVIYLDSPATTSATTYKVQARISGSNTMYVNRSGNDTDNNTYARTSSSITVMEIAG